MQYLVGRWRLKWFRLHFRLYLESCIGFRDQPKHSLVGERCLAERARLKLPSQLLNWLAIFNRSPGLTRLNCLET